MDQLEATLLFANDTFYVAFATGDIEAMDELWAHDVAVSCIHPGGPILLGRDNVIESWQMILGNSQTEGIMSHDATAMLNQDSGWVTCLERIGDNVLTATNIFRRDNGVWKMTHHQSGLCPAAAPSQEPAAPKAN
ncbi:MAG: nuclear transport factor 2 family protein [Magnetovibrio sp.]|nr:nuclear transport factor 2 family protein [Magnetovibrio sp.]